MAHCEQISPANEALQQAGQAPRAAGTQNGPVSRRLSETAQCVALVQCRSSVEEAPQSPRAALDTASEVHLAVLALFHSHEPELHPPLQSVPTCTLPRNRYGARHLAELRLGARHARQGLQHFGVQQSLAGLNVNPRRQCS
eukprot:CAMPEP_0198587514 /NCGR_PEP_ID=MMETSP1462-20131121/131962_1 /TAXON_ID=1333877 /ORGANISM="Brandtodinium nutriculum, Strain RCC3387" /LENGTH=140 /DNA_ID=CAMNT_0044318997 /DNA_START=61 /DNA_END=480 /DNA_ORIENTATION=+